MSASTIALGLCIGGALVIGGVYVASVRRRRAHSRACADAARREISDRLISRPVSESAVRRQTLRYQASLSANSEAASCCRGMQMRELARAAWPTRTDLSMAFPHTEECGSLAERKRGGAS